MSETKGCPDRKWTLIESTYINGIIRLTCGSSPIFAPPHVLQHYRAGRLKLGDIITDIELNNPSLLLGRLTDVSVNDGQYVFNRELLRQRTAEINATIDFGKQLEDIILNRLQNPSTIDVLRCHTLAISAALDDLEKQKPKNHFSDDDFREVVRHLHAIIKAHIAAKKPTNDLHDLYNQIEEAKSYLTDRNYFQFDQSDLV
jgi:hypothetical protein